ncbi:MAG: DUF559 domain-containing protein [Planctomycetes bacterium]|nr:DUF559 domain-containing protein [Planctomycetota bacterium]
MVRVKSQGTRLEKAMESLLRREKIRYNRQPKLTGKPDFKIQGTNILVFCDSSFWHGRREKEITGEAFRKNKAFWQDKLLKNKERDKRTNRALRKEGWKVVRFWDTDILKRPEKVAKRLREKIENNA